MLDSRQKRLIMDVSLQKIPDDVFIKEYPVKAECVGDLISNIMSFALHEKDEKGVEYALYLAARFGFPKNYENLLISALDSPDHCSHDNILSVMEELELRDDAVVDALYKGALSSFDYLEGDREDGLYGFNWNCIYVLGRIGGDYATKKLMELTNSEVHEISEKARHVIEKYKLKTGHL